MRNLQAILLIAIYIVPALLVLAAIGRRVLRKFLADVRFRRKYPSEYYPTLAYWELLALAIATVTPGINLVIALAMLGNLPVVRGKPRD